MTALQQTFPQDPPVPATGLPTVTEAIAAIGAGALSPVELTEQVLARIGRLDPRLDSYVDVFTETALATARSAQDAIARGDSPGPLQGIPVALKDLYDVAGTPTRAGSAVRAGHLADTDSAVTRKLRAAGAVITGKTVTHEFAYGVVSAPARNPWNREAIPGGSSGGSASAVSAQL